MVVNRRVSNVRGSSSGPPVDKVVDLRNLRFVRKYVDFASKQDRRKLLRELYRVARTWDSDAALPNLREYFRPEEMELLLVDSCDYHGEQPGRINGRDQFLRFVIASGYRDEQPATTMKSPLLRTTAVHVAARRGMAHYCADLFGIYDRCDLNYRDERGLTHFHAACMAGADKIVAEFLDLGEDPNQAWPRTGDAPLHLALANRQWEVARLLLARGAEPAKTNRAGSTPLHVLVNESLHTDEIAELLLATGERSGKPVPIDAKDKLGRTPLQLALFHGAKGTMELLLRRGADPNLVRLDGASPLHVVCARSFDDLAESFFGVCDELGRGVEVMAQDRLGRTPLHWALARGLRKTCRALMSRGADTSRRDENGSSPLHVICKRDQDDELVDLFFELCDERKERLDIDALDKFGRTPLQWAVASLLPHVVYVLLKRGADLSKFRFPSEQHFDERVDSYRSPKGSQFEMRVISGVFGVVQRLKNRDYALRPDDSMTIMRLLAKRGMLARSSGTPSFEEVYRGDQELATHTRRIKVRLNLTLHDLLRLPLHEAARIFTYTDFWTKRRLTSRALSQEEAGRELIEARMAAMLVRKFVLPLAAEAVCETLGYALPLECCEKVCESLSTQDMWNACLATDQAKDARHGT
ncbi:inversin-A-like [Trichogramma pretiosum]|uniref:inversin-A-like n=1 Tax=Trichogramma pretiosum TaxID=7493 RepID=UPI0006C9A382|nr:inversin-A-like [Trichogramma pretiosum]